MHLLNSAPITKEAPDALRVLSSRANSTTVFRVGSASEPAVVAILPCGLVRVSGPAALGPAAPTDMVAANPHAAYFGKLAHVARATSDVSHPSLPRSARAYFRVKTLRRQQKRQSLRAVADAFWQVTVRNKQLGSLAFVISNISLSGVAGHLCHNASGVAPGDLWPSMRLASPGFPAVHLAAQVRRVWSGPACSACGHHLYVGLSVQAKSAADWACFRKLVCGVLFPQINWGACQSDAVWMVLQRAGYFDLSGKDASRFAQKKDAFVAFNKQLAPAPALGHQLTWQSQGQAVASIASCRAFSRAHLLHHLGKISACGPDKTSLRDVLVCSLELTKQDAGIEYLCAYLNKAVPFHRKSAMPFARFFARTNQAACLSLQLFELQAAQAAKQPQDAGDLVVRCANQADRTLLTQTLARRFGSLFCQAFDRTPARLNGAQTERDWARAGLLRRRQVFVAVPQADGQRPAAAAVVEMASVGSNLFHIFDAMTVTQLDDSLDGASLQHAHNLLLAQAARWFLQQGVSRFIAPVFAGEKNLGPPQGAADLGAGALWIVHRSLFCLLQEYWHLQM